MSGRARKRNVATDGLQGTASAYEVQEEKMYQILRVWPDVSFRVFLMLFEEVEGITPTESNFRRARERALGLPHADPTEKERYVQALCVIAPTIAPGGIAAKCLLFFGESMRHDIIEEHRRRAAVDTLDRTDPARAAEVRRTAAALISRVEGSRVYKPQGFDLLGDAS